MPIDISAPPSSGVEMQRVDSGPEGVGDAPIGMGGPGSGHQMVNSSSPPPVLAQASDPAIEIVAFLSLSLPLSLQLFKLFILPLLPFDATRTEYRSRHRPSAHRNICFNRHE